MTSIGRARSDLARALTEAARKARDTIVKEVHKESSELHDRVAALEKRLADTFHAVANEVESDLPKFLGGRGGRPTASAAPPVDPVADQIRYEVAFSAHNGSAMAQSLLSDEAEIRGLTVEALANLIIEERQQREVQVSKLFAEQARQAAGG